MKTSIIPIFIPHMGCPHRCVFCNQWNITGACGVPDAAAIAQTIRQYVGFSPEPRRWEVAFYGGSFTAISPALQETLMKPAYEALQAGCITAIRCSTRPDCITEDVLLRLRRYGMRTVELGVQSMDDAVLARAKRGHTAQDVAAATALLHDSGFRVGHQLMPGLPGEDWASLTKTAAAIVSLHPDMTRIYPVVVLSHTELADMYEAGTYRPLSIHEGVVRAAYMKQAFVQAGIPCIRTGLQATADLDDGVQVLAGAYTPAMGELVDTRRYRQRLFPLLDTLRLEKQITVSYHRRDTSRVRGYGNSTAKAAALRYHHRITWQEDLRLPQGTIGVAAGGRSWHICVDQGAVYPADG